MPRFILEIDLGNDAAQVEDIGDLVLTAGTKIMAGWMNQNIRDINGNVVGHYEVV